MSGLVFNGVGIGTIMIALALGYIVCSMAGKEKGALKRIGYLLGTLIILLSSILIIGKLIASAIIYNKICKLKKISHQCMPREQAPVENPQIPQTPKK